MTTGRHAAPEPDQGVATTEASAAGRSRTPVARPAAATTGVLIGLFLVGVAVLAVQNALVHAGWVPAPSWAGAGAAAADGTTRQSWMVVPGVGGALVGLWLLVAAVKPRRRTAVPVEPAGDTLVWTRPVDLARWAGQTARNLPTVTEATSTVTRRKLTVRVRTVEPDAAQVREQVSRAITERLAPLDAGLRIDVKVRTEQVGS